MKNPVKSNNAFVMAEQKKMLAKMGDRPGESADMKRFDAHMSNNGEKSQEFARKLCAGLSDAFPLK